MNKYRNTQTKMYLNFENTWQQYHATHSTTKEMMSRLIMMFVSNDDDDDEAKKYK